MQKARIVATIATDAAPQPGGHYSQATIAGGLLFVAGQLPIKPDGSVLADANFDVQARQAIKNMLAILDAAGCAHEQLARVAAYIVGIDRWASFNQIFSELLPNVRPARTVVPVPELHHGVLVEVDAVATVECRP